MPGPEDELIGLTEWQRLRQNRIRAETVAGAVALMERLDPQDVAGTADRWAADTERFVRRKRGESAQVSLAYVTEFKRRQVGTPEVPWRHRPLNSQALQTSLRVTGPAVIRRLSAQGAPLGHAVNTATTTVAGATSRHALDGGRDGLQETIRQDRQARGWQRVTQGEPCAFCAMLASRGAVFKTGETALGTRLGPTGDFQVHDNCNCTAEPVYGDTPLRNEQAQKWADLWKDSTRGEQDQLNAFRRAYERGNFGAPRASGVSAARQVPGAPAPVRQLTSTQVSSRIDAHRAWAERSGWSVSGEGRRLVGTKPDGTSLVWEMADSGAWRIAS